MNLCLLFPKLSKVMISVTWVLTASHPNHWYVVALSREVKTQPVGVMLWKQVMGVSLAAPQDSAPPFLRNATRKPGGTAGLTAIANLLKAQEIHPNETESIGTSLVYRN